MASSVVRSSALKSRHWPGASSPRDMGPTATRTRRSVGCPTAAVMRRTWRLRPSVIESFSQAVGTFLRKRIGTGRSGNGGSASSSSTRAGRVRPSGSETPRQSAWSAGRVRHALDLHEIRLGVLEPRVSKTVGQSAILGQKQQALAVEVETPGRINAGNSHE